MLITAEPSSSQVWWGTDLITVGNASILAKEESTVSGHVVQRIAWATCEDLYVFTGIFIPQLPSFLDRVHDNHFSMLCPWNTSDIRRAQAFENLINDTDRLARNMFGSGNHHWGRVWSMLCLRQNVCCDSEWIGSLVRDNKDLCWTSK